VFSGPGCSGSLSACAANGSMVRVAPLDRPTVATHVTSQLRQTGGGGDGSAARPAVTGQ
jgi:hypothetical protein